METSLAIGVPVSGCGVRSALTEQHRFPAPPPQGIILVASLNPAVTETVPQLLRFSGLKFRSKMFELCNRGF